MVPIETPFAFDDSRHPRCFVCSHIDSIEARTTEPSQQGEGSSRAPCSRGPVTPARQLTSFSAQGSDLRSRAIARYRRSHQDGCLSPPHSGSHRFKSVVVRRGPDRPPTYGLRSIEAERGAPNFLSRPRRPRQSGRSCKGPRLGLNQHLPLGSGCSSVELHGRCAGYHSPAPVLILPPDSRPATRPVRS